MPDDSTISRFPISLADRGLGEQLVVEVIRQLVPAGFLVRVGTLLEAT